jgi:alpha-L-fucosidase
MKFRLLAYTGTIATSVLSANLYAAGTTSSDTTTVNSEHGDIGLGKETATTHTMNPDAQWYPDAGLGLFIHWGIASVKAINISWPMIPGRALAKTHITDPAERERIIREGDYNLDGHPNSITPNEYWSMARDFNPQDYDPDKWLKAAKSAGFEYVVLTTRHHEGFALWPSDYGNLSTKNFMGGRDLLKPYVEACRRNGLKVGFYYSPPNWYFEKDFKNFMYGGGAKKNPEMPALDADLKPRTNHWTTEELAKHQKAYDEMVRGQVTELLTRYGKIDLLWFDGKPPTPNGSKCITQEEIRKLQPGIVINPRLHGHGDFVTYERTLGAHQPVSGWAEFCNTWTAYWPHVANAPFRAPGYVLGQLAESRAVGVNYLLGVGPTKDGEFVDSIYKNMAIVGDWMKQNAASVKRGAKPLPATETASVPATARGETRYLFAIPKFDDPFRDPVPAKDEHLTLKGVNEPKAVKLLGDGSSLKFTYANQTISVDLPASKRTKLVDVVQIEL